MSSILNTIHLLFLAEVNKAQGIKVLKDGKVVPVEKTEQPQGIPVGAVWSGFVCLPGLQGNCLKNSDQSGNTYRSYITLSGKVSQNLAHLVAKIFFIKITVFRLL